MDPAKKKLLRKVIWTCFSMPILYQSWWAYGWQLERKQWKVNLIEERTNKLRQKAENLTLDQIPLGKIPKAEFDDEWIYKPIKLRGLFDHEKEVFI